MSGDRVEYAWRLRTGRRKPCSHDPVAFDAQALRECIRAAGRVQYQLSLDAGWAPSTLAQYLSRGRCNYFALDDICTRIGIRIEEVML